MGVRPKKYTQTYKPQGTKGLIGGGDATQKKKDNLGGENARGRVCAAGVGRPSGRRIRQEKRRSVRAFYRERNLT